MRVAQVAQTVGPYPWREPPVKLCFSGGIDRRAGSRDAARQRGVLECLGVLGHARSIAVIYRDV